VEARTRVSTCAALRVAIALMLSAAVSAPGSARGQQSIPRSQLASVTQQIAGARVEVVYRRPVARGRALFGSLVPWGRIWTPSADSAARITVSAPVRVNGSPLAAGTYSVWTIPDSASWTVVFNGTPAAFHLRYPNGNDVLRVKATPMQGPHVETLMFSFPTVDGDSAVLHLQWGTTIVPLTLRADTSH
jgi:Protein of unknown function (DUF2911).